MYIMLKPGDLLREGDEVFFHETRKEWLPLLSTKGHARVDENNPVRRNLTGWEAVKYALETEIHNNDKEGCETTKLFWECECDTAGIPTPSMWYDYIHPKEHKFCPHCHKDAEESPDARKAEVIQKIINDGIEEE